MNIGVCIRHTKGDMEGKLAQAAALNIHEFELVSWLPELWTDEEVSILNALCAQYQMRITSFWCGWQGPRKWDFIDGPETLGLVPVAYRHVRVQNLMDGADFAKKLGLQNVITHMGFLPAYPSDPNYPGLIAAIRAIAEHLKLNDQNLLFETGQETPVTLLRVFEDVATGNLFVNLDPGNLIMYGMGNPVDALEVFGGHVRGVHAKDGAHPTEGRHLGAEPKMGTGKVDFRALIRGLKACGYDGNLTIEREFAGDKRAEDIRDAKAYLEGIIAEL